MLIISSEMGFLLTMKSKYGPGGEFDPDWLVVFILRSVLPLYLTNQ